MLESGCVDFDALRPEIYPVELPENIQPLEHADRSLAEPAVPIVENLHASGSTLQPKAHRAAQPGEVVEDGLQQNQIDEENVLEEQDADMGQRHCGRQNPARSRRKQHQPKQQLGEEAEDRKTDKHNIGPAKQIERQRPVKLHRRERRPQQRRLHVVRGKPGESAVVELAHPSSDVWHRDDGPHGITRPAIDGAPVLCVIARQQIPACDAKEAIHRPAIAARSEREYTQHVNRNQSPCGRTTNIL